MIIYSLATAFLMSLSLMDSYEWLCLVGFVPLMYAWQKSSTAPLKSFFISGFLAQFFFLMIGFHWLRAAFQSYFSADNFLAWVLLIVFCLFFSLQWGLIGVLNGLLKKYFSSNRYLLWIFLPFSFTIFDEIVFRFIPFHFGFHLFKMHIPALHWAQWMGLSNLGFLVLVFNFFIASLLARRFLKTSLMGLVYLSLFYFVLIPQSEIKPFNNFRILGIQGHISNEVKKNDLNASLEKMQTVDKYYSLTKEGLTDQKPYDLVVWPETAFPVVWATNDLDRSDPFQADIESFVNRIHTPLITGGYIKGDGYYNATLFIKPTLGFSSYSPKQILFPLGEVIPFNDFWGLTAGSFPEVPRFRHNQSPKVLGINENLNILTPICYEALFTSYFIKNLNSAQLIINLTNDSWFQSPLQKKWHAIMSLSASVDFLTPVLRVTNDGQSGYAKANGEITLFDTQKDAFDIEVETPQIAEPTFFKKNGEFIYRIPRILALLIFLISIIYGKTGCLFRKNSHCS